jgi:hypothetical protein
MIIWHYTYDTNFELIRKDGFIRPASEGISDGEKPIVWFSKEQFWEPTVTKGLTLEDGTVTQLTMSGLVDHDFLLVRIGIDPETAPYTWSELKALSGMPSNAAWILKKSAEQRGANPSKWRGTFKPVGRDKWRAVEFFNPGADRWEVLGADAWFHPTEDHLHCATGLR